LLAVAGYGAPAGSAPREANAAGCKAETPVWVENPQGNEDYYFAENGLFLAAAESGKYAARPRPQQVDPPPPGTYPMLLKRDGSIVGKVPMFRDSRAHGRLKVVATRRPGGDRSRGDYSNHLGPESSIVPGGPTFTRKGCWDIKATSGDATLTATVRVVAVR
jgi:hypothetical protein